MIYATFSYQLLGAAYGQCSLWDLAHKIVVLTLLVLEPE